MPLSTDSRSSPHGRPTFAWLWIALGITLGFCILGFIWKWPWVYPLLALARMLRWLATAFFVLLPVTVIGHISARRLFHFYPPSSRIRALAVALTSGWGLIILVSMALLAAGLYSDLIWPIFAGVVDLAVLFWLLRRKWRPLLEGTRRAVSELRLLRGDGETQRFGLWDGLVIAALVLILLLALVPPNARDELAYHLVTPRLWNLQHDWWVPADNYHMLFPANLEAVWGYGLAAGGETMPRLLTLGFALLTLLMMADWLRENEFPPWVRGASLAFFLITPVILLAAPVCYVEWPLLFFLFVGWRTAHRFLSEGGGGRLLLMGMSWGIALGTKYSVFPVIGLLGLDWLFRAARRVSVGAALRSAGFALLGFLVFCGPWLVRNAAAVGDPVYPLGGDIGLTSTVPDAPDTGHLTGYAEIQRPWRFYPWSFHALADRTADHRLHPGWLLLHAAVLLMGWRYRRDLPWAAVLAASLFFWLYTPAPRVYMPLLLLVWLFLPRFLRVPAASRRNRIASSLLLIVFLLPSLAMSFYDAFLTRGKASQEYLLGFITEESFLRKDGVLTPVMEWVRDRTPGDARLWAWGEDQVFHLRRWVRAGSPYDPPAFLRILREGGGGALTSEIEEQDIDFILINRDTVSLPEKTIRTEKRRWTIPDDLHADLTAWIRESLRPVQRDHRYELYRVVRAEIGSR